MFHGSIPALVTPFTADGAIDWAAFDRLVDRQVEEGSHGVVPCGTTGESPCLSDDEMKAIVERTVARVKGRIPVIAGTGSNSTAKTITLTKMAKTAGATAALIVAPYYNKPTQEGLFQHFKTIHDQTDIPIVLYNVPGRTGVDMSVDLVVRLSALPRIVGIKDATTDTGRVTLMRAAIGKDFCLLSGEDGTAGAYLAQGGDGCISVTANAAPGLCADLQNAWRAKDLAKFAAIQETLAPLHRALFVETSPAPVKYALSALGLCGDNPRLPLLPATPATRKTVDDALAACGLIAQNGKARAHG